MHSGTWCDSCLGCPVQGQELDSVIMMGPFQLNVPYDSMNVYYRVMENTIKLFMITEKTLWANARRKAAHKIW